MSATEQISIDSIPEIRRRKSESFSEIDAKVRNIKPNQAMSIRVERTKKGELNRQFSVKVGKHLGSKYTVVSRMGSEQLKQDVDELYVYIYITPPAQTKPKA